MTFMDEWQPGRLLANICRLHATRSDQLLEQIGLYRGQAILLLILSGQDGRTHTEIAQELHISPAATTKIIQRLEKMEFLQRRPDPSDERLSRVYLLEGGRAVIQQIKDSFRQLDRATTASFTSEEQEILRDLLIRIFINLKAASFDTPK
jgi:DNA-binding MarR family transcriptional regulator